MGWTARWGKLQSGVFLVSDSVIQRSTVVIIVVLIRSAGSLGSVVANITTITQADPYIHPFGQAIAIHSTVQFSLLFLRLLGCLAPLEPGLCMWRSTGANRGMPLSLAKTGFVANLKEADILTSVRRMSLYYHANSLSFLSSRLSYRKPFTLAPSICIYYCR